MEDRNPSPYSVLYRVVPGTPLATIELIRNFAFLECTLCPEEVCRVFLTRTGYNKHREIQHGVEPENCGLSNLIRTSDQQKPDEPTSKSPPATETSGISFLPLLTSTPKDSSTSDISQLSKSPGPESLGSKGFPSKSNYLKVGFVRAGSSELLQSTGNKDESISTEQGSFNHEQIQRRFYHDREESNLMYSSVVPQSPEIEPSTSKVRAFSMVSEVSPEETPRRATPTITPTISGSRPTRKAKGKRGPKPKPVNNCRYCSKSIPPGFNTCTVNNRFYPEACKPCSLKYSELFVQVIRSRYSETIYKCSECNHEASRKQGCMVHLVKHANPNFRIRAGKNSKIKFS